MDTYRGFKQLVGKTINFVDAEAVNDVFIGCSDGSYFSINADDQLSLGAGNIPIIKLVQHGD